MLFTVQNNSIENKGSIRSPVTQKGAVSSTSSHPPTSRPPSASQPGPGPPRGPPRTVSSKCFSSKSRRDERCGVSNADPDKYFSSRQSAAGAASLRPAVPFLSRSHTVPRLAAPPDDRPATRRSGSSRARAPRSPLLSPAVPTRGRSGWGGAAEGMLPAA
ncbi:hypothetical protein mRhiFer1_010029 [Rhinolophus ferrumequinum]|uniref:Uncharacterized protein n=1 Tax=Rhinolophus ferrumequinum TaxID=59479 RepID=A0A7J7Y5E7_RHIFE|nr:hypothetical protein mRhiFer1_010029 [Rhinolophus ferrumequinum]